MTKARWTFFCVATATRLRSTNQIAISECADLLLIGGNEIYNIHSSRPNTMADRHENKTKTRISSIGKYQTHPLIATFLMMSCVFFSAWHNSNEQKKIFSNSNRKHSVYDIRVHATTHRDARNREINERSRWKKKKKIKPQNNIVKNEGKKMLHSTWTWMRNRRTKNYNWMHLRTASCSSDNNEHGSSMSAFPFFHHPYTISSLLIGWPYVVADLGI